MRHEELYYFSDPKVKESLARAQKLCAKLRVMSLFDEDYRKTVEELIPGIPPSTAISLPFHCDHGTGIVLGENVFLN